MHLTTLIHKISRRIRVIYERNFPHQAFAYQNYQGDKDRFFKQFEQYLPFENSLIQNYLTNSEDSKVIIDRAEAICRHEFDLLGSGTCCLESKIDWHIDFKSGYKWDIGTPSSKIEIVSKGGADIKVPWELSRFNHAVMLGLCWLSSSDEKYVLEFVSQIDDWIVSNPIGFGVNWINAMETAIRSVNWIVAFMLMNDVLDAQKYSWFRDKMVISLWEHARFISSHLEWLGPKANVGANHLLADITGLFTLGLFFYETRKGEKWTRYAFQIIEMEMQRQVFEDGVHFECSPYYHRQVLEMFLWCGKLAKQFTRPFSTDYYSRLKNMQKFVADYMYSCNKAPLVGDNDNGRFINSGLLQLQDHSYLKPEANPQEEGEFYLDRFLLDGVRAVTKSRVKISNSYPDAGFYFLNNSDCNLLVRAGKIAFKGTHAHNDQLSFELSLNNEKLFTDRGTYVYTSNNELRNRFRSNESHNTIRIDNYEQNLFLGTFKAEQRTKSETILVQSDAIICKARLYFNQNENYITHTRYIRIKNQEFEMTDYITNLHNSSEIKYYFHLHPTNRASLENNQIILFNASKLIGNMEFCGDNCTVKVCESIHSPSYGVLLPSEVIIVTQRNKNQTVTLKSKFRW